ncbi:MAG TPA: cation:proton antiporter [Methanothrix sp.]|nr:cation:proton antiporter [Methanothrix sp.]HPJ84508.1 cation:proton antiporter [Methanothrix sp.]
MIKTNAELGLSLIILAGFLAAKLFRTAKIPAVTSYILVGIVIGPSGLGVVPEGILAASGFISDVVLGLIAFGIGRSFSFRTLGTTGRIVVRISAMEALGAMLLVTAALTVLLDVPLHVAVLFGAIASATAPAATVMVVKETRAKGPMTDTLLGVVALDDAWALMIFAVSMVAAKTIASGGADHLDLLMETGFAVLEIGFSLILGAVFAWLLHHYSSRVLDPSDLEVFTLGIILLTVGAASSLGLSVLLACLALGVVLVNISSKGCRFFEVIEPLDTPLYLIFFVLAGALLEIGLLKEIGLLGLAYIVFRVAGKLIGAYIGASDAGGMGSRMRKYIGLGLIPQAGVALGLALMAREQFPNVGETIFSTIVATTVVFELAGPIATRTALSLAHEIPED